MIINKLCDVFIDDQGKRGDRRSVYAHLARNMDFLMKSFTAQGFTVLKQKNKDLEAGLNTVSFHIEKNTIYMAV